MRRNFFFLNSYLCISILCCLSCKTNSIQNNSAQKLSPTAKHKQFISYDELEDLNDPKIYNWYKEQDSLTDIVFSEIPMLDSIYQNILRKDAETENDIYGVKIISNGDHFYYKDNQETGNSALYLKKHNKNKDQLLFDPLQFDEEAELEYFQPSWNGEFVVIGISSGGKEFSDLYVMEVETKKMLNGKAKHAFPEGLGGVEWLNDNSGFIYTYVPIINSNSEKAYLNSKAVLYRLNEDSANIQDIFSCDLLNSEDCTDSAFPIIEYNNPRNNYLIGQVAFTGTACRDVYISDIADIDHNWKQLWEVSDQISSFELVGDDLYFLCSKNNEYQDLCLTSASSPNIDEPIILASGVENRIIKKYRITRDGVYYTTIKNGVEANLHFVNKDTTYQLALPSEFGSIDLSIINSNKSELWIIGRGWINAAKRYRYIFNEQKFEEDNLSMVNDDKYLDDCVVKEVEIKSHDGVLLPVSIVHKKDLKLNGSNRVFIEAYGAFGYVDQPYVSDYLSEWVSAGGVYVVPHVRGGGAKGPNWHKQGMKENKHNSWEDFIACTEYLIKEGYTKPSKIVACGESAGGITIGRAITERPELYAAAIIEVGLLNTLKFEFAAAGKSNTKEFGTVLDSAGLKYLTRSDVISHIQQDVSYPAIYATAGMNDARVDVWHAGKLVAKMQDYTVSQRPILLDINFDGGHASGTNIFDYNYRNAQVLAFAMWQTTQ